MREEDLAARFRAGDDDAARALLERHDTCVRRRIAGILPNRLSRRVSISDVVQETHVVAIERRVDFEWRGDGSFRAWLLAIAENKAHRAVQHHLDVAARSVAREATGADGPDTRGAAAGSPSPSQAAMRAEEERAARAAMARLSDDDRDVLRLCVQEGRSIHEAAELRGRSYEATKKQYGRALLRFTEAYADRSEGSHG